MGPSQGQQARRPGRAPPHTPAATQLQLIIVKEEIDRLRVARTWNGIPVLEGISLMHFVLSFNVV